MTGTFLLSRRDQQLRRVAGEYERKGYRVTIQPAGSQLPEFLHGHRPDILAEGEDESVIIELRSRGEPTTSEDWRRLADLVGAQPGWRLELMVHPESLPEESAPLERAGIEGWLEDGRKLTQEARLEAGFVLTWAATEAALRLLFEQEDVDAPDLRPATVITRLYTDGMIDREDYDLLMDQMRVRNAIVHGFREPTPRAGEVDALRRLTKRILRQCRRRPATAGTEARQ